MKFLGVNWLLSENINTVFSHSDSLFQNEYCNFMANNTLINKIYSHKIVGEN